MRPQVGAEAVGGESQIVVEADGESGCLGVLLNRTELAMKLPLNPHVKGDGFGVFLLEGASLGRNRILIAGRPIAPEPQVGILRVQMGIEGAEGGKAEEQVAFVAL